MTDLASFTEAFTVFAPKCQVPEFLADKFPGFYLTYAEEWGLLEEGEV